MFQGYENANGSIHSQVQNFLQGDHPFDEVLVQALLHTFLFAPPQVYMKETPTPVECKQLIKYRHPDLQQVLEDAIQRGLYEDVMSLPFLHKPARYIQDYVTEVNAVFGADNIPYVGHFPQALVETLDEYFTTTNYNHCISIVQSSGMGKSRGVKEATKIRFAFLFNVRSDIPGFPFYPSDLNVRKYLLESMSYENSLVRWAAFLCSLFICARKRIASIDRRGVPLAEWWYKYLNDDETVFRPGSERVKLYGEVIDESREIEQARQHDIWSFLGATCEDFVTFLQGEYSRDNPPTEPPVTVMLVFDEFQDLNDVDPGRKDHHYHHFRSVLGEIARFPVFAVCLSANPNILMAPGASEDPPPFTELPFDALAWDLNDELVKDGKSTLNEVCSVDVMARFGRPMWHALHKNDYPLILWFAEAKLNPIRAISSDITARLAWQLACLAIRIGSEFDACRKASRNEQIKLVELYMHALFPVSDPHEVIRTGAPSEPILAEAAAQQLHNGISRWCPSLARLSYEILSSALWYGVLERERRGEMMARLLWTLAYAEVRVKDGSSKSYGCGFATFHRPIRLLDFLRSLFHEDYWDVILNARPIGDPNGPTLSEAFRTSWIFFSHFMDAVDYPKVDFQKVYFLLLRGAALICRHRWVDFLTPILFGSPESTPISISNVSVLQAQVRKCTEEEIFVPTLVKSDHPILSIVHELESAEGSVECTHPLQNGDEAHKRHYRIVSRGCTSKTYGVIPSEMDQSYPTLLGSNVLVEDFPRRDQEESMTLFRRLQPCTELEQGQQSSWFGEDVE